MALGLNKVSLIGNVGNDPEFRFTKDGKEFSVFSLATTESWKDRHSGVKKERTEWHRIIVFSEGLVSIVRTFVQKGSKLFIEGSIQTRKFVDSRSQEVHRTEIVLQGNSVLILLDSAKKDKTKKEDGYSDVDTDIESELDDSLPNDTHEDDLRGNKSDGREPF